MSVQPGSGRGLRACSHAVRGWLRLKAKGGLVSAGSLGLPGRLSLGKRGCRPAGMGFVDGTMHIIYIDESGDDGVAPGASPLFALAFVAVPPTRWVDVQRRLGSLSESLQSAHGFPATVEWHSRPLLLRKHPYRELCLKPALVRDLCSGVGKLVSESGVSVSMRVLAKDGGRCKPLAATLLPALASMNGEVRLAFSDQGRIGTMRRLVHDAMAQGQVDDGLVESVVGMASHESRLIQVADLFATAAYLRVATELALPLHARMRGEEVGWMTDIASGPNRTLHLVRA